MLCTLSAPMRQALRAWLLAPTDLNRWPPPDTFKSHRVPIQWEEIKDHTTARELLDKELRVIRQTLDFPPEAISVLSHNGLLIVHAIRLRQLEYWFWPVRCAREITMMIV